MAIERHVVELSARDTLSPVLKKVGTEAERAGRQADDAGKKASRSMQDWGRAASALGTALGVGIGASIKIFNEAEVVQARLRTAIENTGHAYDEYADAIDKATDASLKLAFDDEDAADSIAELTTATGDASKAINDLALAQDIARGRGISLAQATDLVIAAETGRFRSLQLIGIKLDENATKEDYLAALQGKYAGQAEAYAKTNQATWDRFGNTIENTLESIGGHLADFQGPLVALSAGATALGPLGQAFEALDGKAKLASASSKALSLALSPGGLLGAVGLLTAATVYLVATTDEFTASAQAAERESADLANSYAALAASIEDVTEREKVRQTYSEFSGLQEQAQKDLRTYQELQNAVVEWKSEFPQLQDVAVGALNSITEEQQEWLDFNHDGRISIEELTQATEQFGEKALLTSKQAGEIGDSLTQALSHADVDVTRVLADYNALEEQWKRGEITGQQFADGVEDINRHWGDYTQYTLDAAAATDQFGISVQRTMGGMRVEFPQTLDDIAKGFEKWQKTLGDTGDTLITTFSAAESGLDGVAGSASGADSSLTGVATGFDRATRGAVAATGATNDLDDQLSSLSDTLGSMTPASVLDSTFGAIVGFTDRIVGSIDKVKQWSDALMAPLGTDFQGDGSMSKMLDLLQRGKIDTEDYNEALDAQTRIYGDLGRAQDAQAAIQIKQSNYIADAADVTADYLESIAALPEAEQATALAWADSDISGRAEDIANMAAEWDNMSTAQQAAFEQTTLSAAKMDPMLANLLFDLGLIKGNINDPASWVLSMDSSDAESDTDRLIGAIDDLIGTLSEIYHLNVEANLDTGGFWAAWNALPSYKAINVHTVNGDYGPTMALGGVSPWPDTAALGRVSAGNMTLVGENGPEIVNLPGGALVTPNHASRYMTPKGGGGITIQNMTVVANDPQQFMRQMRQYSSSMERR